MRKFQEQEENFQKQEKRHDDQLYEVEKQYMLDRDRWNFCLNYSEILHVLTELNSITNSTWLKLKIELFFFFLNRYFRLQKELEKRLLQLSADFQATFQLRIASHTQRVIRENVAVNNELATMMSSWKEMMDENFELKQERTKLQVELSHVQATRDEIQRTNMRKQQVRFL